MSTGPLNSPKPTASSLIGGVYNVTPPTPADKQAMALQVDNEGNLLVNVAVGGGGGGGTVDQGTPGSLANGWPVKVTDGINVLGTLVHPLRVDLTGTTTQPVVIDNASTFPVYTTPADPTTSLYSQNVVNFSSSGANTIVSASGSTTIRIFRLALVISAATSITLQDSTPTAFTGAMSILANGSIGLDGEGDPLFVGGAGKAFQVNSSNAVQVSGTVWYTQS